MTRYFPFFVLISLCVLVMFYTILITPSLSFDDLFIARQTPQLLSTDGWGKTAWWALTLPDVGQTELRTYGLTRLIQVVTVSLFGTSPALTMGFVITIHATSGILIYLLLIRARLDMISSALLAIAWVASPAVVPTIRTEHHWLYLIAPYYPLVGWVLLNDKSLRSTLRFCSGSALLVLVWSMGEAPVIPLLFVCCFSVLTSPNWRTAAYLGGQATVAITLMCAYLFYQLAFHNDPTKVHRIAPRGFSVGETWTFIWKLWDNAKGILGLPYTEFDLGAKIPSLHVADSWEVWTFFTILIAVWLSSERLSTTHLKIKFSSPLIVSVLLIWIGSITIYFVLTLLHATVLPMRYTTAFFLFTPLGFALTVAAFSQDLFIIRSTAAVIACFTVSFSTVLTLTYEYSINQPSRTDLARFRGLGLVVYYPETPRFKKGEEPGFNYPGLVPINSAGYGDSKKSFWTLVPMFEQYAGAAVGSECKFTANGDVEIFYGKNVSGIRPRDQVVLIGTDKDLDQICGMP